jgi:hypothetical protein
VSRLRTLLCATVLVCLAAPVAARAEEFGFKAGTMSVRAINRDGTPDTQAGSHPYSFTLSAALNTGAGGFTEGGAMRDLITDLPPGMIGDPLAVPRCPREDFEGAVPQCSPSTQVGIVQANFPVVGEALGPLYNLAPAPGSGLQLGFAVAELTALSSASLRSEAGYAARVTTPNVPLELNGITVTIWGTPADPSHDAQRGQKAAERNGPPVASDAPLLPFFTLPTSCGQVAPEVTLSADSKLAPGVFVSESAPLRDEGGNPTPLTGCESVPFSPAVAAAPTTAAAESPSGLGFALNLANQGLLNPKEGAITETEPTKTVVTLPEGITANPAAAAGQGICSEAQFDAASAEAPGCPAGSKLGSLSAASPLLEEAIEGSVYLAAPHQNRFGTLLALYIVARAPARGVVIKQAGRVDVNQETGQLTTTIEGLPPIPYSGFELHLREGPRAPLITPQVCGTYAATAELYPFSAPVAATMRSAPFKITTGANGAACASGEAELPNAPAISAGATVTNAGAYSPFVFKLSREDGTQRFSAVTAEPPLGLTAKLAGIPYCPESGIAQAMARTAEGDGALEQGQPSCPAASQVGTVVAGAGAGTSPYFTGGKVYLAGPYKGAPLSFVAIAPAIAGPFDLGVVASRIAVYVDETTAKITVKSDPLPQILHGIPLDLRSISVRMDRPEFTLNPTNCEPTQVKGSLTSLAGAVATLAQRFQVGGCRNLEFPPKLKLQLKGGTTRTKHPALKSVLTFPTGGDYANIASAAVTLPHSEIIDPFHIGNPCTRPEFAEEACPRASVLGRAKAWSPLLEAPLEGKVYFRSNGGERELPDVVADLRGQVHLVLIGATDTVTPKTNPRIRTTFFAAPDAPVSRFELQLKGGKEGLLVNSENLCRSNQHAVVRLVGQNGKVLQTEPKVANSCGKKQSKRPFARREHR